jgi:Holliday junction resolvase RusA-like endonuclease
MGRLMGEHWSGIVPVRAMPKARPRSGRGKRVYMPKDYQEKRKEFGWELRALNPPTYDGRVSVAVDFRTDGVFIGIMDLPDATRPTHVRGDLDNLVGFVFEVMEDIRMVKSDNDILVVHATAVEGLMK